MGVTVTQGYRLMAIWLAISSRIKGIMGDVLYLEDKYNREYFFLLAELKIMFFCWEISEKF